MCNNEKKSLKSWQDAAYSFFCNRKCEFFPCHPTENEDNFNCLFCFCPLYAMDDCGGSFEYLSSGVKDCGTCSLPHDRKNYGYVIARLRDV